MEDLLNQLGGRSVIQYFNLHVDYKRSWFLKNKIPYRELLSPDIDADVYLNKLSSTYMDNSADEFYVYDLRTELNNQVMKTEEALYLFKEIEGELIYNHHHFNVVKAINERLKRWLGILNSVKPESKLIKGEPFIQAYFEVVNSRQIGERVQAVITNRYTLKDVEKVVDILIEEECLGFDQKAKFLDLFETKGQEKIIQFYKLKWLKSIASLKQILKLLNGDVKGAGSEDSFLRMIHINDINNFISTCFLDKNNQLINVNTLKAFDSERLKKIEKDSVFQKSKKLLKKVESNF